MLIFWNTPDSNQFASWHMDVSEWVDNALLLIRSLLSSHRNISDTRLLITGYNTVALELHTLLLHRSVALIPCAASLETISPFLLLLWVYLLIVFVKFRKQSKWHRISSLCIACIKFHTSLPLGPILSTKQPYLFAFLVFWLISTSVCRIDKKELE